MRRWSAGGRSRLGFDLPISAAGAILWIVAEDKLSGQRVWLVQIGGQLSIMYKKVDEKGLCYGETRRILCKDQKHMAQEIDALFARAHKAA